MSVPTPPDGCQVSGGGEVAKLCREDVDHGMLRALLRYVEDGVALVDDRGALRLLNEKAARLSGWPEPEALGRPLTEVLHFVRHAGGARLELAELTSAAAVCFAVEGVVLSRLGDAVMTQLKSVPLRGSDGAFAGAMVFLRDLTLQRESRRITEKLQQLEIFERVASGIAHDFNNHVMVVGGSLALARSMLDSSVSAELVELLDMAEEAARRAQSLTQQILTFSKEGTPVKQTAQVKRMLEESVRFLFKGSVCNFAFELPDDLWHCEADAGQVGRIVQNIVMNALRMMPLGGKLQISAANILMDQADNPIGLACGGYIRIVFADTGAGFDPDTIGRLFEPGFAVDNDGLGAGLAAAHASAQSCGGNIVVDSVTGQGTRFSVYLPAVPPLASKSGEAANVARAGGSILIMDDDEDVQRLLSRMLEHIDCRVVAVNNGSEAVRVYKEARQNGRPFNAVILDLTVPGQMGACETMAALREFDPAVKAIIASGRTDDPAMVNWQEFHFAGVLLKPFQMQNLLDLVRKIIASA